MNLVRDCAGALLELADDERVDVLVGCAGVETRVGGLGADRIERVDDLRALLGGEDADTLERPRERLRAADIGVDQAAVEIERAGEALEDFGWAGLEPAAPEFHAESPETEACVSTRSNGHAAEARALICLCRQRPDFHREADEVDEAEGVLLVVRVAHREAGDVERVERVRALAAERLDVALVETQLDFAGGRSR